MKSSIEFSGSPQTFGEEEWTKLNVLTFILSPPLCFFFFFVFLLVRMSVCWSFCLFYFWIFCFLFFIFWVFWMSMMVDTASSSAINFIEGWVRFAVGRSIVS